MAQLSHHQPTVDMSSTMEPAVAADESTTAEDVGSVQDDDAQNVKLVVELSNNRTIEILLRGKLLVAQHNSGSGGGPAAEAAAGDDTSSSSSSYEVYMNAKVGWMMMVAALFVQMSFQAAVQPPTWIPANWLEMFQAQIKSVSGMPPSPPAAATTGTAATPTLTGFQAGRVGAYVLFNTVTFATALTIMIVQLMGKNFPLMFKVGNMQLLFVAVAMSSCVTYVMANSYDWHVALAVSIVLIIYCFLSYLPISRFYTYVRNLPLIQRRIAGTPSSSQNGV